MQAESRPQLQSPPEMAQQPELPLLGLHQAIEQAGAYQFLVPRRQIILKAYLTTEATMGELKPLAGVKTMEGVHKLIHRSMQQVFPHLPEDIQKEYNSPKEAIRIKAGHHTKGSLERLREGLDKLKEPDTNKREFSGTHRQHLTDANLRRWQRAREANKATQPDNQ